MKSFPEIRTISGKESLEDAARRLAEASQADEVYLFGSSLIPESRHASSDIDLCFIVPDEYDLKAAHECAQRAFANRKDPMDLVGFRRGHFRAGDSLLAREVLSKGQVIFSRKASL